MGGGVVNLAVVGAVHRFQHELFPLLWGRDRLERVLPVFLEMSRCLVEADIPDMGCRNYFISFFLEY